MPFSHTHTHISFVVKAPHDLKMVWKCILEALQTPLNPLKSSRTTKRHMHVRILPILRCEMPLISCIKGDHLIIPGVLDQGATAEHRPMLFFFDERRWMEGIPFHRLQCAPGFSVPAHHWGTAPCHHAQKANIETITKTNTYPWNRHVSSHPRLSSVVWGGRMFEPASKPVVTFKPTRDQKVCSVRALCYFFLLVHMHALYTLHYT